jgi:glycolate oxidase iron-sulfur subunit
MHTELTDSYRNTALGQEAYDILRACVHCGFCTATCPTYQLLGDELDSPRGRIYLIKQVLEGSAATQTTQIHLDRCLTCRACETTCPSGVRYGRLVELGREVVDQQVGRSTLAGLQRRLLRLLVPYPARIAPLLRLGQAVSGLLPGKLRRQIPPRQHADELPPGQHERKMLVLEGCVQSIATPVTNTAAVRLLDRLGIQLISVSGAGCCGAVSHHLGAVEEGRDFMRRNIDAWWPYLEQGAEAIIVTASGCGSMVREYADVLRHDPQYAGKAARVSAMTRDLGEVLRDTDVEKLGLRPPQRRIAFQSPCTLQHGMQLDGVVESVLKRAGFELVPVADPHLCCGSAGTYSILQPGLSRQLLERKLATLEENQPQLIATANIGCQLHMASHAGVPVRHWIELLAEALPET